MRTIVAVDPVSLEEVELAYNDTVDRYVQEYREFYGNDTLRIFEPLCFPDAPLSSEYTLISIHDKTRIMALVSDWKLYHDLTWNLYLGCKFRLSRVAYFVLNEHAIPVAVCTVTGTDTFDILSVYVVPAYRRRGIGNALIGRIKVLEPDAVGLTGSDDFGICFKKAKVRTFTGWVDFERVRNKRVVGTIYFATFHIHKEHTKLSELKSIRHGALKTSEGEASKDSCVAS